MENAGAIDASRTHSGTRQRIEMLIPPVIGGLVLLIALLGLIGTAIRDPKPHDIAVGLVGPAPAVQQISTAFGANAPRAFQFTTYGSEADATAALDSRAVDGVLILGGQPRLIVAGAAGDGPAGVMTAALPHILKHPEGTRPLPVAEPIATWGAHRLDPFLCLLAV